MVPAAVKEVEGDEEEVEPSLEELQELSNQLANIPCALQQDKGCPHANHLPDISTLVVGGGDEGDTREDIRVHTSVLLARCPYFSAMVSSGMMGSGDGGSGNEAGASSSTRAGEFRLPCLSPQGVRAVVRWLYSARLPLTPSSLLDVVHAAKFLQVPGVEACCARYVQRHAAGLDPGAALPLLDSAQALASQALEEAVEAYIAANMQEVMRCVSARDQYAQVSGRQLLALLRRSDLAVPEEGLFHWLASWSRARQHWDGGEPQLVAEEAAEVFDHVSYAAMPHDTLRTLASAPSSPPTPSDGPETLTLTLPKAVSRDWLVEALQCRSSPELLPSLPERQRARVPSVPLLIHGRSGVRSGQMLDCELRGGACWHGPVLDLTATYSYAEIADLRGALAATRCFHVEAWVCPSYLDDEDGEIYYGHDYDAYSSPVISRHGSGSGWELRLGSNGAVLMVTLDNSEDMTTNPHSWHEVVRAQGEVELGKWVHVAGRYDGQYLEVYLNGRRSNRRLAGWGNQDGLQDPRGAKPVHYKGGVVNLGRNPSWTERKLVCKLTGVRVMTDSIPQAPDGFLPLNLGEPLELGQ